MRKIFALVICTMLLCGEIAIFHLQTLANNRADARAEELLRQARAAIGGDAAINAVKNLVITGKASHSITLPEHGERQAIGNVEMALDTSGKLHKKFNVHLNAPEGAAKGKQILEEQSIIVRRRANGSEPETLRLEAPELGEKIHRRIEASHTNELARMLLGLLATASPTFEVIYNYLGEGSVDGASADIIEARGADNFAVKLYFDKQSHLPLMMSYRAVKPQQMLIIRKGGEGAADPRIEEDNIIVRTPEGEKVFQKGDGAKVFFRKVAPDGTATSEGKQPFELQRFPAEEAEFQVRFAEFRSVNGLMLPHRWTESVN